MKALKTVPESSVDQEQASPTKRAVACFSEIAGIAGDLDRQFYYNLEELCDVGTEAGERAALFLSQVRISIAQMGWLADLGSQHSGGGVLKGGATEWLMSPVGAETMRQEGGAA